MQGERVRRFVVGGCVGRGGFGEVYRARVVSAHGIATDVAVKVLHAQGRQVEQATLRLRDEARLLAQIRHPSIVVVRDLINFDGHVALVTEFVEGEDLATILSSSETIAPRPLVEVIGHIASALDAAWNGKRAESGDPLRVAHRDVKPSNIRIGPQGEVKLLDFGIARSDRMTREAHTATNAVLGSLPFMAPERFLAEDLHAESDVWSLGAVLYEGLAGQALQDLSPMILATMAIDPKRHERFIAERIGLVPDNVGAPVLQLLRDLLAVDHRERPDFAMVSVRCDEVAERMQGPTLRRWCLARRWGEAELEPGPLTGKDIVDGTLEQDPSTWPENEAKARAPAKSSDTATGKVVRGAVMVGGGAMVALIVGAVAIVILGVAFWGAWMMWGTGAGMPVVENPPIREVPKEVVEEPPVTEVVANAPPVTEVKPPVAEEPPVALVSPQVEKVHKPPPSTTRKVTPPPETSKVVQTPKEEPVVVAPPVEEPPPVPQVGTVKTTSQVPIQLHRNGYAVALGEVPAGTYDIQADFGEGFVSAGNVTVAPGDLVSVQCSRTTRACKSSR